MSVVLPHQKPRQVGGSLLLQFIGSPFILVQPWDVPGETGLPFVKGKALPPSNPFPFPRAI